MSHQHVNDAKILAGKRMIHFPIELRSVGYVYISTILLNTETYFSIGLVRKSWGKLVKPGFRAFKLPSQPKKRRLVAKPRGELHTDR